MSSGLGNSGVGEFLGELAAPTPIPAAGGALALTASTAAALVEMTASISAAHPGGEIAPGRLAEIARASGRLRTEALALAEADAIAYRQVLEAMALAEDDPARAGRVRAALSDAADPPLRLAEIGAEIADLAALIARNGRKSIRGDATVAAVLAEATCHAAAKVVEVNIGDAHDARVLAAANLESAAALSRKRAVASDA
ncbi:MAG TPA: cyclodeaminase/cyclohydrolase family protein [Baekduia sp.]|nr:cyclodeaminase/cyclohydrolase family protein [Baekduia sp.]